MRSWLRVPGLTGAGLTAHRRMVPGLTEHGLTEHGLTEHGLTGSG